MAMDYSCKKIKRVALGNNPVATRWILVRTPNHVFFVHVQVTQTLCFRIKCVGHKLLYVIQECRRCEGMRDMTSVCDEHMMAPTKVFFSPTIWKCSCSWTAENYAEPNKSQRLSQCQSVWVQLEEPWNTCAMDRTTKKSKPGSTKTFSVYTVCEQFHSNDWMPFLVMYLVQYTSEVKMLRSLK